MAPHVYVEWLPPSVAERAAAVEPRRFSLLADALEASWQGGAAGVEPTLRWVSVINNFMISKGSFEIADVERIARTMLEIFMSSPQNFFGQVRWSPALSKILRKYRRDLTLTIPWRPLYELMLKTHFGGRHVCRGAVIQSFHGNNLTTLIRRARRYFPPGAAAEIWAEFRPKMNEVEHNDALRALGFLVLFLPVTPPKQLNGALDPSARWSEWVKDALELWDKVPNCDFWDKQWGSLLAECTKHLPPSAVDWTPHLPSLFTQFVTAFELPVGKAQGRSPVDRQTPKEVAVAFGSPASRGKTIAKSVIFLLHFGATEGGGRDAGDVGVLPRVEAMVDCIEQYYHPSNGGQWTVRLETFLRCMVFYLMKRLAHEGQGLRTATPALSPLVRRRLVTALVRLIERAQYSKNNELAGTAAMVAGGLAYVEPTVVLPLVVERFRQALNTVTATHQTESALLTMALSARPLLLASAAASDEDSLGARMDIDASESNGQEDGSVSAQELVAAGREVLAEALQAALPGIDANDPPKTRAALHLFFAVVSSVGVIGGEGEDLGPSAANLPLDWAQWLNELLSRIFSLITHLEDHGDEAALGGGVSTSDGGLGSNIFRPLMELLFSRCSPRLYEQALNRVTEFALGNVLGGSGTELGDLCGALLYANPQRAVERLMLPAAERLLALLEGSPKTGFSALGPSPDLQAASKASLSPALETSVRHHLTILNSVAWLGGAAYLPHRELILRILQAGFDSPSLKITEHANTFLVSVLQSLLFHYPTNEYEVVSIGMPESKAIAGVDFWWSTRGRARPDRQLAPTWHKTTPEELKFAEELLVIHLDGALVDLRTLCQMDAAQAGPLVSKSGERDAWRVVLLRIDACIRGCRTCLPDFAASGGDTGGKGGEEPLEVIGEAGTQVGSASRREETAMALHQACQHLLQRRSDDVTNLTLLTQTLDELVNYGTADYREYTHSRTSLSVYSNVLTEPRANFVDPTADTLGRRRPRWLLIERTYALSEWRASQVGYRLPLPRGGDNGSRGMAAAPEQVKLLLQDLVELCMNKYKGVRNASRGVLEKIVKRYPHLRDDCMVALNKSLAPPGGAAGEADEEAAVGACSTLMTRPFMRLITQDWNAMASFIMAILGSACHESSRAQASLSELFLYFTMRFDGVPPKSGKQLGAPGDEALTPPAMVASLMTVGVAPSTPTHWRYTLMAHAALLLLVDEDGEDQMAALRSTLVPSVIENGALLLFPTPSEEAPSLAASSPIEHFLASLTSELPPLRALALIALLVLLPQPPTSGTSSLVSDKASSFPESTKSWQLSEDLFQRAVKVLGDEKFGSALLGKIALDRHLPDASGARGRGGGGSNPDAGMLSSILSRMSTGGTPPLVQALGATVPGLQWPLTTDRGKFEADTMFSTRSAFLIEQLAFVSNGAIFTAVRTSLTLAAEALADRALQCCAAEVAAGLLRYNGGEQLAATWQEWLGPLLRQVLANCTVESLPVWKRCVRFAATDIRTAGGTPLQLRPKLLEMLAGPVAAGATSGQVAKRLQLLEAAFGELTVGRVLEEELSVQAALLEELRDTMDHPARQVREAVGSLLSLLTVPRHAVTEGALGQTETWRRLRQGCEELTASLGAKTAEAARLIYAKSQSTGTDGSGDTAMDANGDAGEKASRWIETVLHWLVSSIKSGDAASQQGLLVAVLPAMLALQETPDADLAMLAKQALAYLKYQPLGRQQVAEMAEVLRVAASGVENWHTRAAALAFLQSFMYRNAFLLSGEERERLEVVVLERLSDTQLEVRELASGTLSGLLRGGAGSVKGGHGEALRERCLALAQKAVKVARKQKKAKGATKYSAPKGESNDKGAATCHGAVLGLSACIASTPYDVPRWMPDALMLLAEFSSEPPPVRTSVTKAFGEFRRTHADTWAVERLKFTPDQLETLSELTMSQSYFV
eukprot:TRINITY_DN411_c0_g2_i2.p1 TRINITY_DN411_c0_g2~~TRINITY_DN411_c0_g2_i2.p1  ORF type:complete len:1936 (-),score=317.53 TRINITY_DN411_c0_g2_i2:450-6257(-)